MDPLGRADLLWAARSSAPWPRTIGYRLRRLGRLDALEPPRRRAVVPRGAAAARRLLDRRADRRRGGASARSPRRSAARAARCGSRAGTRRRTSRSSAASRRPCCASCWRETVARGVDVRVLLWAGAPLPRLHAGARGRPSRRARARRATPACASRSTRASACCTATTRSSSSSTTRSRSSAGSTSPTSAAIAGTRPQHPARGRLGWHDAGSRLRGPIVADVAEHLDLRWTAVTGEQLPAVPVPAPAGETTIQLLRTVPERVYDRMRGRRVRDPRGLHARAAGRARARLPRVAVLLAAGDRRACSAEQAARPAERPLPRRRRCCRPRPTTARRTRAGCSPTSSTRTPAAGASWPRRSTR